MTPDFRIAEWRKAREKATSGKWAWGRLIEDQAGDYVVWRHRGAHVEGDARPDVGHVRQGSEPQRTYIGNVGGILQPIITADINDVLANQVFEAEASDAAFIALAANEWTTLLDALEASERETEAAIDAAVEEWLNELAGQMRRVGVEPRKDENKITTVTNAVATLTARVAELEESNLKWFNEAKKAHAEAAALRRALESIDHLNGICPCEPTSGYLCSIHEISSDALSMPPAEEPQNESW